MSGVNDSVPAYRLNQDDLVRWLRNKFPEHSDFQVQLARDQYNISIPKYLERADLDEITKLRKPVRRRRAHHRSQ